MIVIISYPIKILHLHVSSVASLEGPGGGPPRVSPFWGDTILWSKTISPLICGEDLFSILIWTENQPI